MQLQHEYQKIRDNIKFSKYKLCWKKKNRNRYLFFHSIFLLALFLPYTFSAVFSSFSSSNSFITVFFLHNDREKMEQVGGSFFIRFFFSFHIFFKNLPQLFVYFPVLLLRDLSALNFKYWMVCITESSWAMFCKTLLSSGTAYNSGTCWYK